MGLLQWNQKKDQYIQTIFKWLTFEKVRGMRKIFVWVGWSERQGFIFSSVAAAFVIIPSITFILGYSVANTLLWLTGIIVLAYTVETQGLRLEMVRQNEMAVQPLVIATIEEREVQRTAPGTEEFLVLRNIGRGTALFVKIKDVEFAELEGQRYVMKFCTIDYIQPGIDHIARPEVFRGNEQTAVSGYVSHLDPSYAIQNLTVGITYEDINGQKRESVIQMGKDGIKLLFHRLTCPHLLDHLRCEFLRVI